MPGEDNKILKCNQGEKSMKVPFTIYADLDCLLEKMNTCHNNPEKSSTTKINKHTPSGYSLFTHCSFDTTKNKLDYYRGKNCMKNFCLDFQWCFIMVLHMIIILKSESWQKNLKENLSV